MIVKTKFKEKQKSILTQLYRIIAGYFYGSRKLVISLNLDLTKPGCTCFQKGLKNG